MNGVEPCPFLVVGRHHRPRRDVGVGCLEHRVAGARVVVPSGVRLQVHRRQLPELATVLDAILKAARLLFLAHLKPELDEDDARLDHRPLNERHGEEKLLGLLVRAEFHHSLDASAVVPTAIKDDDFTGRREMRDVSLDVHLAPLALGRSGQRDHSEDPWAHAFGEGLDRATFSSTIPALEHDADLESLSNDPLLHGDQLDMESLKFLLVLLPREFLVGHGLIL